MRRNYCGRSRLRAGRRDGLALGLSVLALAVCLAGCGEAPSPPIETVENYLNALGAGNYVNACGYLDNRARQSLVRTMAPPRSCARLFSRCLPKKTIVLNQDQTQLLYANIDVTAHGASATATTSGTAVARELKQVTLRHQQSGWRITGFGQAIERCRILRHHDGHEQRSQGA